MTGANDRYIGLDDIVKVYAELKLVAHRLLRGERTDHTLQTTDLVNETLIKIMGDDWRQRAWSQPAHFFNEFARNARWVLIGHARHRSAAKRDGGWARLPFDDPIMMIQSAPQNLLCIDDLLEKMATAVDLADAERKARVVTLKVFGNLSIVEIATVLAISVATVKRDWTMSKLWLTKRLHAGPADKHGED